jgi:hypothetical protein
MLIFAKPLETQIHARTVCGVCALCTGPNVQQDPKKTHGCHLDPHHRRVDAIHVKIAPTPTT